MVRPDFSQASAASCTAEPCGDQAAGFSHRRLPSSSRATRCRYQRYGHPPCSGLYSFSWLTDRWPVLQSHSNFSFSSTTSEEHTSELQSRENLVGRLPLEKKNK